MSLGVDNPGPWVRPIISRLVCLFGSIYVHYLGAGNETMASRVTPVLYVERPFSVFSMRRKENMFRPSRCAAVRLMPGVKTTLFVCCRCSFADADDAGVVEEKQKKEKENQKQCMHAVTRRYLPAAWGPSL